MCKMLYILIFSTLLFSCSDSENLDSVNSEKQDPKAVEEVDILRLAAVKIGDKWGYVNQVGKVVIEPQFGDAKDFSVGLALVRINNKRGFIYPVGVRLAPIPVNYKWEFINREGKFFDNAGTFSEGLRRVKIGDKWGYVNQVGKVVIEPQFDDAEDFSVGLAAIKISDKWGYINHKGEIVIKPQFDDARSFQK